MSQVLVEKTGTTQVTATVRVPHAELSPLLPKAATKISSATEIDGFRKGHAPYEVVRARVGEFKILEETARLYISDHFEKIIGEVEEKEYKAKGISLEPVGEPQVAITKLAPGDELEFKITLAVLPPLELPDYKAVAKRVLATKKILEVTDQEVVSSLQWLRESRAKLVTVNRGACIGDRIEVDFSITHGGVKIDGGESKNHPLVLGQGRLVPGFEDELVGMKAGEEKTFTLTVPDDYRDGRIAGQALGCKTTMKLVQEREVPAWDDAFAKSLGNFALAADAEKNVREGLGLEKEAKERERLRMAMLEAIAQETRAEIPEVLIDRESEKMLVELKESTQGLGLKFDQYLGHIKKTEAGLKAEWRPGAGRRVKFALILREIARREGIRPSQEETQQAVDRVAAHRGLSQTDQNTLDRASLMVYASGIARNEKVFEHLERLINA